MGTHTFNFPVNRFEFFSNNILNYTVYMYLKIGLWLSNEEMGARLDMLNHSDIKVQTHPKEKTAIKVSTNLERTITTIDVSN